MGNWSNRRQRRDHHRPGQAPLMQGLRGLQGFFSHAGQYCFLCEQSSHSRSLEHQTLQSLQTLIGIVGFAVLAFNFPDHDLGPIRAPSEDEIPYVPILHQLKVTTQGLGGNLAASAQLSDGRTQGFVKQGGLFLAKNPDRGCDGQSGVGTR